MTCSILNSKKYILAIICLFIVAIKAFSQNDYKPGVESFESEKGLSPYEVFNGKLALTEAHKKYGKSSLQWKWNGKSKMGTSHFSGDITIITLECIDGLLSEFTVNKL